MTRSTTTPTAARLRREADAAWNAYLAAKAGRRLFDLSPAEMDRAMEIHAEFSRLDRLANEAADTIRVRSLNVSAIHNAIDYNGSEWLSPAERIVVFGRTYVEGSVEALEELADAIDAGAADNIEEFASGEWNVDLDSTFGRQILDRSIRAAEKAAWKIRFAISNA